VPPTDPRPASATRAEIERVLGRSAEALERGERVVLAVVAGVTGSSYRKEGAAMAIGRRWTEGGVSAGCLESDVVLRARDLPAEAGPTTVEYDTGDVSPYGLGIGCGGRIRIALRPLAASDAAALRETARAASADAPFEWTLPLGQDGELRTAFPAPDHLHLYGAGSDSGPVCELAARVGFRVTVIDHRSGLLSNPRLAAARQRVFARPDQPAGAPRRCGRVFAVVKTHDLERDRAWLGVLRASPACYIGIMGPSARVAALVASSGGPDSRIRGPVGLDLGGDGPDAVALSVVAELCAIASGRSTSSRSEIAVAC
jgi:xanthine dehydrogenase accessory factor